MGIKAAICNLYEYENPQVSMTFVINVWWTITALFQSISHACFHFAFEIRN